MSTSTSKALVAPEVEPFCMRILFICKNQIAVHRAPNMDLDLLYLNPNANFGVFAKEKLQFSIAFPEVFPPPYLHCFHADRHLDELPEGWFMMPIYEFLAERSLWTPTLQKIIAHACEYSTGREVNLWMELLVDPGPLHNMRCRFFDYLRFRMGLDSSLRVEWSETFETSPDLQADYKQAQDICLQNNVRVLVPERFPDTETRIGRQTLTTDYKRINDAKQVTGFQLQLWIDNETRTNEARGWLMSEVVAGDGSTAIQSKEGNY